MIQNITFLIFDLLLTIVLIFIHEICFARHLFKRLYPRKKKSIRNKICELFKKNIYILLILSLFIKMQITFIVDHIRTLLCLNKKFRFLLLFSPVLYYMSHISEFLCVKYGFYCFFLNKYFFKTFWCSHSVFFL